MHDHYSIKRAFGTPKDYIKKANELGLKYLSITNYHNDHAYPYYDMELNDINKDFKNAGSDERIDIKFLYGVEFFVTEDMTRKGRPNFDDINYGNDTIIFMAKNMDGYRQLLKILSDANQPEHYFMAPRIDWEYISELNAENLICLIPHDFSTISKLIMAQDYFQAKRIGNLLKSIFSEDLYIEISSNVSPINKMINEKLLKYSDEMDIQTFASNNVHYPNKEDKKVHDVQLASFQKKTFAENDLYRLSANDHYMKTEEEVYEGLKENGVDYLLAECMIKNSNDIAEQCYFEKKFIELSIPNPPIPEGFTNETYFRHIIDKGWEEKIVPRINNGEWDEIKDSQIPEYKERIEYEFDMIKNVFKYKDPNTKNIEGFIPYMLLVADYTKWAKGIDRRIMHDWPIVEVGPGRGSVGGSIIGYLTDVTTIDAVQYGLTFERFINPERVSWPDIDLDFDPENAWCVEIYLGETYGWNNVAHILTFQTAASKKSFEVVSKTLSGKYGKYKNEIKADKLVSQNELNKLVPIDAAKAREIQNLIDSSFSLKDLIDPESNCTIEELYELSQLTAYKEIFEIACKLEGSITSTGSHPGAVIIADNPLWEHTSFVNNGKYPDGRIMLTTSYEKYALEEVNTMKYDILRLRELSIVKETKKFIYESLGLDIDLTKINPYDIESNLKILKIMKDGDLDGIFQISSALFKGLIEKTLSGIEERGDEVVAAELFDIIVALEALGRPGPLGSGMDDTFAAGLANPDNVEKVHPIVDSILEETYGNMIYQEQIMFILQQLGGFTLGQADMVRRGIASGKEKLIEEQRQPFIDGVKRVQLENNPDTDEEKMEDMVKLANYVFDWMVKFAQYGFNKAHSVEYGKITHQGLWLKANYKPHFMASLMSAKSNDEAKIVKFIDEIRSRGIKVFPPKINKSLKGFTVVGNDILFGLEALKGVGPTSIEKIIEGYPYKNVMEFIQKVGSKKFMEPLIKSNYFDEDKRFLLKYWQVLLEIKGAKTKAEESLVSYILENGINEDNQKDIEKRLENIISQKSLKKRTEKTRNECLNLINRETYTDFDILSMEKESLGLYLSQNPLEQYEDLIYSSTVLQKEIKKHTQKEEIFIVGMVMETPPERRDKNGNKMCFMQLQMIDGMQDCVVFSQTYEKYKDYLIEGKILICKGKKGRGGGFQMLRAADLVEKEQMFRDFFGIQKEVNK